MFLYRKSQFLPPEVCNTFIELFESSESKTEGVLYNSIEGNIPGGKKSTDLTFNPSYLEDNVWGPLLQPFIKALNVEKHNYFSRYEHALSNLDPFEISTYFNLQKYNPNEGFFAWHCERASIEFSNRVLVWMVYLNTITDRGETEFYYQHHFEPAEQGKLIIWPSDWTYLHRGVSSPTQTKYILTGWFTHVKPNQ